MFQKCVQVIADLKKETRYCWNDTLNSLEKEIRVTRTQLSWSKVNCKTKVGEVPDTTFTSPVLASTSGIINQFLTFCGLARRSRLPYVHYKLYVRSLMHQYSKECITNDTAPDGASPSLGKVVGTRKETLNSRVPYNEARTASPNFCISAFFLGSFIMSCIWSEVATMC